MAKLHRVVTARQPAALEKKLNKLSEEGYSLHTFSAAGGYFFAVMLKDKPQATPQPTAIAEANRVE